MAHLSTYIKNSRYFIIPCTLLFLRLSSSAADTIAYEVLLEGIPYEARCESVSISGVRYVSLNDLVDQLGGNSIVLPIRMKVDFAGRTAWVQNEKRSIPMSDFTFSHPILRKNNDFLIAIPDAPSFFESVFHVTLNRTKDASSPSIDTPSPRDFPDLASPENHASGDRSTVSLLQRRRRIERPVNVVIIDAGHGGHDIGIQSPGGILEKDLTLAVALKLYEALAGRVTQTVVLTRTEDTSLTVKERAAIARKKKSDLLISLHAGGLFSSVATGYALYYPPSKGSASLSQPTLQAAASPSFDTSRQSADVARTLAGVVGAKTSLNLLGILEAPIKLFSLTEKLGVHVEIGCLTNAADEELLSSSDMQETLAKALAEGIATYLDDLAARAQLSEEIGSFENGSRTPRTFP